MSIYELLHIVMKSLTNVATKKVIIKEISFVIDIIRPGQKINEKCN